MLTTLLAATLAAAPVKIAQTELRGANMQQDTLAFFGEHLAGELRKYEVSVVTAREISTLLGLERQKELLGCADATACVAELANALGVDGVLVGDIGHFGDIYQVELKVLAAGGAGVLAAYSARVSSEQAALDTLDAGARELSKGLFEKLKRPLPDALKAALARPNPSASSGGPSVRLLSVIPAAVTVIAAVVGGIMLTLASGAYNQLEGPPSLMLDSATASGLASSGSTNRYIGIAALAVGGAALVTAAGMFLLGGPSHGSVGVAVAPGGMAAFTFSGALP